MTPVYKSWLYIKLNKYANMIQLHVTVVTLVDYIALLSLDWRDHVCMQTQFYKQYKYYVYGADSTDIS